MAHFLVRHPFGASIAIALLFKIIPDDFVEPEGSHQSLPLLIKQKAPIGSLLFYMAEREGFEPSIRDYRIHTFQACSFNHSDTSPEDC